MFSLQKIPVTLCFILLSVSSNAGDPHLMPAGAAQAGMAYVSVMRNDFWSAFHNQAALARKRRFSAGISYENRFGLAELGTTTAALQLPAGKTGLGIICSRFGYHDYNRNFFAAACGLPVAENLTAGVQVDYFEEHSRGDYTPFRTITFEAGIQGTIGENTRFGVHLFNPLPSSLRKYKMVSIINAGAGTNLTDRFFAGVEGELRSDGRGDIRTGFEYSAKKDIVIRGGFHTRNSSFCFGIGYRLKGLRTDISFSTHNKLGISTSVTFTYDIN